MTPDYFKQVRQKVAGHYSCFTHMYINSLFKSALNYAYICNSLTICE